MRICQLEVTLSVLEDFVDQADFVSYPPADHQPHRYAIHVLSLVFIRSDDSD